MALYGYEHKQYDVVVINNYEDNEPQTIAVFFHHPNREMLKNQLGMFVIETLIEYQRQENLNYPEAFVNKRIEEFMRILEGKRGF